MAKHLNLNSSKFLVKAVSQDVSLYGDFIERLNHALAQERFSIFAKSTFERISNSERQRKVRIPIIKSLVWVFSALTLIAISALIRTFNYYSLISTLIVLIFAISSWSYLKYLIDRPESHLADALLEGSPNYGTAKIVQTWMEGVIANGTRLFIQNASEDIYKCSQAFLNGRNAVMVALGTHEHRQVIGIPELIPEGPFMYRKDDEEDIFASLESALELNRQGRPPNPKVTPSQEQVSVSNTKIANEKTSTPLSSVKTEQLESFEQDQKPPEQLRILSAKKRGTYYEKASYKAHDNKHLKTVINNREMLGLLVDYLKTDDAKLFVLKDIAAREGWGDGFKYMYDHPAELRSYLLNKTASRQFVQKLYGPEMFNFPTDSKNGKKRRKKFRLGEDRDINNFIIECYVIPVDQLLTDSAENTQPNLFGWLNFP